MNAITVLLVDDHRVVRQGLRALLEEEGDMTVVGEAESGRQAVEMAAALNPRVIIMDVAMPSLNGIEATRQITKLCPGCKIISLSSYCDDEYVQRLTEAGAISYLVKDASATDLIKAVREAFKGNAFFSPSIARRLLTNYRQSNGANAQKRSVSLTSRENEVIQLVAEGRANKQIADELSLSIKTVQKYRQQVMDKLNIHETAGLTRYAIANGIVASNLKERAMVPTAA